jgi:hypothetical protein
VVLEIRFVENPGVLILRAPWSLKEQYQMKIQLSDNRQIWANGADIQDLEKSQELLVTLEKDWIKPDDILQYYPMVNGVKQKYEYGRVTAVYKAQPIYTDSFTVPDSTLFEPVNMIHVKDQMESAFDIYSEGKKGIRPPGAAEDDEYEYESKTDRVLGKNVIRKIIPPSPTGAPTIVPTIPSREPESQEYSGFGPYFQRERKDYGTEIPPIPPIPTQMSSEELQAKRQHIWQYAQAAQRAPIQPTPEFKDIKMIPKKKGGK